MFEIGVKLLLSYLLGSLVGALIVGHLCGGVDIRTMGSGNAGGTNALRTRGKVFALWVILIDVGKGVLATAVIPLLPLGGTEPSPPVLREWLIACCAAAVILGHVYPLWFGFRGGKGAATLLGALLGLSPPLLALFVVVWLALLLLSGYVGLATIAGAAALPAYLYGFQTPLRPALFAFCLLAALFLIFTHRSNITRMLRGEEQRVQRLWLLRK